MSVVRTGLVPRENAFQLRECGVPLRRLAKRLLQPAVLARPAIRRSVNYSAAREGLRSVRSVVPSRGLRSRLHPLKHRSTVPSNVLHRNRRPQLFLRRAVRARAQPTELTEPHEA